MQIIFKAITGSFGYAFWWKRTALHSMDRDGGSSQMSGEAQLIFMVY